MIKTKTTEVVDIENILPHPKNFYVSSEADLKAMITSIEDVGIRIPPLVTPVKEEAGKFRLISGHLRTMAAKEVGIKTMLVDIQVFEDEDDELDALIDSNNSRPPKPSEIAKALYWKKKVMAKKKGTRSDLENVPAEERIPTREKLARMYRISPTYVDNYEKILEEKPELFKRIDAGAMSINGAVLLLKTIGEEQFNDLDETEMMLKVIELVEPEFKGQVDDNTMSLDEAFQQSVRLLSKKNKPQPKKETEATNQPLVVEETNPASTTEGSETPTEQTDDTTSTSENSDNSGHTSTSENNNEAVETEETAETSQEDQVTLSEDDEKIQKDFSELISKLDAEVLSQLILNYVDDADTIRQFLESALDIELKEQVLEGFKEEE